MASNLVRGTAILTIGLFLSKVLGLLYIIPLYQIVGEEGIGLYNYAYIPYNLALAVAVSGAPLAISKFVSKYNALGDYATGRKLMKSGVIIMSITGFIGFLALYFLATPLAEIVNPDKEQVEEIASVIRAVSFAVLVVPLLSISRGYLQGYQKFEPTSVSQFIEQLVRVIFVVVGSYIAVSWFNAPTNKAVNFAVFAAFIGAIAGLLVLWKYFREYKDEFDYLLSKSPPAQSIPLKDIYREVITYTLPFVLVGTINPLYQFVDMITFSNAMSSIGIPGKDIKVYFGILNTLTHKFVMIPVMVATGFSMALISIITAYYTKNDHKGINRSLDQTYQILLFLTIPMVSGLILLSNEFYQLLYEQNPVGSAILASYAPVAILFALFTVTAAILQGIDRHKWIVLTSLLGLLIKMIVNIPLIKMFETNGSIMATALGYSVAVGLNLLIIAKTMNYQSKVVFRRIVLIGIFNIAMVIAVYFTLQGLYAIKPAEGRFISFVYILVCVFIGATVYGILAFKSGLAQKLFGDRLTTILQKVGIGR